MALSLAALSQIRPMTDPAVRARSLADLRAMGQEEVTRGQAQQLNALDIQGKQTANDEWAQVKAIFDKHSGDKEGAIAEVLQHPWRSKEITDTYQNEATRMRQGAVQNATLQQGQVAPTVATSAPQATTAPIQASLTDPSQMSSPQVSAEATQQIPLPLPSVQIPFGGPKILPKSAQQVFQDLIRTKQAESDIAQQAKAQERQAAADVQADKTVDTGAGIYQWNPATKRYDIKVGDSKTSKPAIVQEYEYAKTQGYKGSFEQYQNEDTNRKNPVISFTPGSTASDPKDIAAAIIRGEQPPNLIGLYRDGAPVRAELARKGFDLATAQRDWNAIQKHLSALNGAQQERLRQAVTFTYDSLDNIEDLYKQWKATGLPGGFKVFNRGALAAAKQLPGEKGSVAQNLEAQINDLASELGTVYKGGNASTDESLRLASENLKAEWNDETFNRALGQIRKNLSIRRNSILTSQPVGVSPNSPYRPEAAPSATQAPAVELERGPDGKLRVKQ